MQGPPFIKDSPWSTVKIPLRHFSPLTIFCSCFVSLSYQAFSLLILFFPIFSFDPSWKHQKIWYFLPTDTHTYVCVSGNKNCWVFWCFHGDQKRTMGSVKKELKKVSKSVKKAYNLKDYFRRHDEKLPLTCFREF